MAVTGYLDSGGRGSGSGVGFGLGSGIGFATWLARFENGTVTDVWAAAAARMRLVLRGVGCVSKFASSFVALALVRQTEAA